MFLCSTAELHFKLTTQKSYFSGDTFRRIDWLEVMISKVVHSTTTMLLTTVISLMLQQQIRTNSSES